MDLKAPLSFNEQLEKLKEHGMLIDDESKAIEYLKQVNYYRFTGYALQFRKSPDKSEYVEGTTFDKVKHLYQLDVNLRDIFRKYIEILEVYYRTQIAYGFSIRKCVAPPHNQHYDKANFFGKDFYDEIMSINNLR